MGRPRTLSGQKLAQAREWYARYLATPSLAAMALELSVRQEVLRRAVTGKYRTKASRP